jgi:hypothetical protein
MHARITARHPLHYSRPAPDRPSYVRAASSLTWFGERLAIVQDDTLLVALVDAQSFAVEAIDLPLRADGARTFDVTQGNKKHKADFEACVSTVWRGAPTLLAFGSGSHENRESIALLSRQGERFESRIAHVPAFYAALRALPDFLSSELNLEGALLRDDTLRLFQRSNGTGLAADSRAYCATCDLSLAELLAHLTATDQAPVPTLGRVRRYELGQAEQAQLTFTDAALLPNGTVAFSASAESSPNAYDDGAVTGSALGLLVGETARLCPLLDERGVPVREKVEGLAFAQASSTRAYLVFDPDDHRTPATLAEVALKGF